MSVFATDPMIGAGLPLWLPAGAVIRQELEQLAREIAQRDGCLPVYSPVLGKRALYERSGHWEKFSEDMFPPIRLGGDQLVLRPANCPHHAMIYAAEPRSYRQLPIRLNELASVFRAERSGVVSGLSRVRQISLDDTHVFCRSDQTAAEVACALRSALRAQGLLGLPVDYVRLSRRDTSDSYLGSAAQWQDAEQALRSAAAEVLGADGPSLVEAVGEAAFYGPKLDLQMRDQRGHEETIATVQLDFNQPERFDLTYDAADGTRQRVVMIIEAPWARWSASSPHSSSATRAGCRCGWHLSRSASCRSVLRRTTTPARWSTICARPSCARDWTPTAPWALASVPAAGAGTTSSRSQDPPRPAPIWSTSPTRAPTSPGQLRGPPSSRPSAAPRQPALAESPGPPSTRTITQRADREAYPGRTWGPAVRPGPTWLSCGFFPSLVSGKRSQALGENLLVGWWRWRCLSSGHRARLSRDIVHT